MDHDDHGMAAARAIAQQIRATSPPDVISAGKLEQRARQEQQRVAERATQWAQWARRADELLRDIPSPVTGVRYFEATGWEGAVAAPVAYDGDDIKHAITKAVNGADAIVAALWRAADLANQRQQAELDRLQGESR